MITLTKPQLASSEIPDIYTQVTWPKIPRFPVFKCIREEFN